MKKFKIYSFFIFILILLGLTGCKTSCKKCNETPVEKPPVDPVTCTHIDENIDYICDLCKKELERPTVNPIIEIQTTTKSIELKDEKVNSFDFKQLFTIKKDKINIDILDSYINKGSLSDENVLPGTYTVTCEYENKSASVEVVVIATIYEITLEIDEITINKSLVETYDFISLFKVYKDGKKLNITEKMISSNVTNEEGKYEFTITYKNVSKTLIVNVTNNHKLEVIPAFNEYSICISDINIFDFKKLFCIYLDGKIVEVTNEMLNFTTIESPVIGGEYNLELTYSYENDQVKNCIKIIVVKDDEIKINAKNIVIYPNQEQVDLTSLFTITKGEQNIIVTHDMIEGSIDYSKEGINHITINYMNISAVATVEIKRGVIIDYTYGDSIVITKGTNQDSYPFINDFRILINGILFTNISNKYIKDSNVDFSTPGEYQLTIAIPYNDKKFGLSGVKFDYFEKTITYVVVENDYQIQVISDEVVLPIDSNSYDPFNNLNVYINGRKQKLTNIKEYVDVITCYAKVVSKPIDFNYIGIQEIIVEVYANGVNNDPVIVRFNVIIESDIVITSINKSIYTGDTVYAKDLFEIKKGSETIEISNDMITGILDVYTPGKYYLEINFEGITKIATVVVLDGNMKGNYVTNTNTFYVEEDDDSGDIDYYSLDSGYEKELKILDDGTIIYQKNPVEIIEGINESTFRIKIKSYEYTLYYDNGIIVLNPNNDIKLTFNEDKVPMVFFNKNIWTLEDKISINYSSVHAINATFITYTFDAYKITSLKTNESYWYGMKINLVDKMNSDTVYTIDWDYIEFGEGFVPNANSISTLKFKDESHKFKMNDSNVGVINKVSSTKEYANKVFVGSYDGLPAELRATEHEGYYFYVNGEVKAIASIADINNMQNGGTNHLEKTVFIYDWTESIYSYKFKVDPVNNTFEYIERDSYYGMYKTDNMYVFIDGYGTGFVNFNSKSYYNYSFEYTVNDGLINAKFINTKPTFEYGEIIKFYIPEFKNIIEIKDCYQEKYIGILLENVDITTGAIVRIDSYRVGQDSDAVAKANLLNNIHIITKDKELSYDEKVKCIDTSRIRFNTPGFYQMTITINVDGNDITQYYAIEVLESIYQDKPIIGAYGNGVIFDNYSLELNKYGQVILICDNVVYNGFFTINENNTFNANVYDDNYKKVNITGNYLSDGLISVKCTGNITFNDYFTKGSVNVIGTKGCYIREIIVNNKSIYIYSEAQNGFGEIVELNIIDGTSINSIGTIIELNSTKGEIYLKINGWGNVNTGLILSDIYRGTYINEGNPTIVLNGFGNATINNIPATYEMNGRVGILTTASDVFVYNFNIDNFTYKILDVKLDNSLVEGKTFVANHTFYCGYYAYTAQTKFIFASKGVVTVISTSDSHDSGDDSCTDDIYEAPYANKTGVKGTYNVSKNILTVNVNGYTFTFVINDVVNSSYITCKTNTLTSDQHGYIENNTIFNKE